MSDSFRPLRIGLFTHSTNPRGGVVHCLELAEALAELGHSVVVHGPARQGRGYFRAARHPGVKLVAIPAAIVKGDLADLVRQRIKEYLAYLYPQGREFDVYHAHDGLSGSVMANLVDDGTIPGFVRTVHHLDDFTDDYLIRAQDRSITAASRWLCVSRTWRERLAQRYGVDAQVVPNGVDMARFTPDHGDSDVGLLEKLMAGSGCGPTFLAVGGVEKRKNTINALKAFLLVRKEWPRAALLIAGGASLMDHSEYRSQFDAVLAEAAATDPDVARSVVITGPLPDAQMPAAYRLADALVFPSITEGFGLAVLESMACGTPVVASAVPPFTEYLTKDDALLVDPYDVQAIAAAMQDAVVAATRARLREAGLAVARRFPWSATAAAHAETYRGICAAAKPVANPAAAASPDVVPPVTAPPVVTPAAR